MQTVCPECKAPNPSGEDICSQCGACRTQCASELDVPTMMRCYMYVYGYRNVAKARETMERIELPGAPCAGCGSCRVSCPMGFDVRRRLTDVARLRDVPAEFIV